MRPQLAGTPASSLRAARCRADLQGEKLRASCRLELDPAQATALAAALADPDGPTWTALAGAGFPSEALKATASGESLTVSMELPLSVLSGRG